MSIDKNFNEYFGALDRAGNEDRCFLCRRSPADVKLFFGFHEDGTPLEAESFGLEDVVLGDLDIMSYRGTRPICAVCQLNFDTIFLAENGRAVLDQLLHEMEHDRDRLWMREDPSA
ncbi:MAG: hypothetical protein AAF682_02010 [Planctomycetota bacterium]